MIKTQYLCDLCGQTFTPSQVRQAREHEKLPITEGDFDGVVAYESSFFKIYFKEDQVNNAHERLYREYYIYEGEIEKSKKGEKSLDNIRVLTGITYSWGYIQEMIRGETVLLARPATQAEVDDVKAFLGKEPKWSSKLINRIRALPAQQKA
jgi:hypothetical protein